MTNESDLLLLKEKVVKQWGHLDILINNAGILRGGPFLEVPASEHLKTIDVNLCGLIRMTHLFLPDLIDREESRLVQIGSVTGLMGLAFGTSYAGSKWGVLGFSESLRQELRALKKKSPHICVVCPSYIATGMFDGAKAPKLMPFLHPAPLAAKILKAVEKRRSFVKEPFMVKTVPFLRTLLPLWAQDWLLDWFGVAEGMRKVKTK